MTAVRRPWPASARRRRRTRGLTFESAATVGAARPTVVLIPNRRYYFLSGMLSSAILVVACLGFWSLWPAPAAAPAVAPRTAVAQIGQALRADGLTLQVIQVPTDTPDTHVFIGYILDEGSPLIQADHRWWLQASDFSVASPGMLPAVQLVANGQTAGALAFSPGVGYFELKETRPCALQSGLGYQPYPHLGGFRFEFDLEVPAHRQCERAHTPLDAGEWLTRPDLYLRIPEVS